MTGENLSTRTKTCPSNTLSTKNLLWTEPVPPQVNAGDREPETWHSILKAKIGLIYKSISKSSSYGAVNTLVVCYKNQCVVQRETIGACLEFIQTYM
jgi:hypothetical protein